MIPTTYSTREATELAGVTYRQADYWARNGVLSPLVDARGSGTPRRYTTREVQVLWALGVLGPDPRVARALLHADRCAGWVAVTPGGVLRADHLADLTPVLEAVAGPVTLLDLARCPVLVDAVTA